MARSGYQEELEQSRREWARERSELTARLGAAEASARDAADELEVLRAAVPPASQHHHMRDDDKREVTPTGCEEYDRVCRERAVLARQLQEAKMALADVKTSWSGQIASLETQVARLSRQAGEEGAERRIVEMEKKEMQDKLQSMAAELEKTKQNLINSEAKVARLNGEVHSLAMEVKGLRNAASHEDDKTMDLESRIEALAEQNRELSEALENETDTSQDPEGKGRQVESTLRRVARLNGEVHSLAMEVKGLRNAASHEDDKTMDLESRIEALAEQNRELSEALENERTLVKILREKVDKSNRLYDESKVEVNHLNSMVTDMQHDYMDMQRKFDKEKREKDEALLRNAHMSQTIEMSQCDNQAACMLIKENEESRKAEIEKLNRRIEEMSESENALKKTIQDLETEICDKNKKIKTLDNRISDMKKTLQRELQSSKPDLNAVEEQDISRRYLKHVVLRFLTARELEARQLTRALSTLLRLSAHEEALLRAALPPRSGLSAWFPSLNT
ncbi:hypothetical protein MSG28_002128 [Choristoneura fumiferana]|uniref:Uncharacterized protein n=1 Tax=Choristoneura fumiferana TaxID=7141 RepID=A0ACC0JU21_CHOFU|nr:hypothetical protein MSG28_002128 [Choristoneura fumiferana]